MFFLHTFGLNFNSLSVGLTTISNTVESLYVQPILVLDIVHDVIFYLFHIHSKIIGFVFEPVKQLWDIKCRYKFITLFKMIQI